MTLPDVLAITDPLLPDDDLVAKMRDVVRAVPRASLGVQLRDRTRSGRDLHRLALRIAAVCREFGAPFYLNDRVDLALAVGADGVHLGGSSIDVVDARRLLGTSAFVSMAAHSPDDVDRASSLGATAALVSPIFETPGKGAPRGTTLLADARARAPGLWIYALGGVGASGVAPCLAAGANGVAAIRAIWHAVDPGAAALELVGAVRAGVQAAG